MKQKIIIFFATFTLIEILTYHLAWVSGYEHGDPAMAIWATGHLTALVAGCVAAGELSTKGDK